MTALRRAGVLGLVAVLALAGYVRLAPSDPAAWHRPVPHAQGWDGDAGWGEVLSGPGAARLRVRSGAPADTLARLDAIAMATARTRRLAGSVAEGRVTWITRSLVWGFPDYTTAEARADGVYLHARLRFGGADFGVNAARLTAWRDQL